MNLIMSKQTLLPILTNIVQATATHGSKPITEAILFSVKDKVLTICGTDAVVMLNKNIPVECIDGQFLLNARRLLSIIKAMSDDTIVFDKAETVKISSGKSKFELATYGDTSDFPTMPAMEYETQFTTNSVEMFNRIVSAMAFTSDDNLRAVLTAVYLESSPEGLNIVATDSVRLVHYKTNIMIDNISVMLPKRAIEILKNLPKESVSIGISESGIKFETGDYTLIARLINGKYPAYKAIIPQGADIRAICDKDSLLSSLARMSLVANPITKLIKFKFTQHEVEVSAQDSNSSSGGAETLTCGYNGAEMTIGFNYSKLIELLKLISGDVIHFDILSPKKPVIIRDPKDESLLALIMPSSVEA
jgi:DNA polymerase III subunit beta